jgi:hypothetical protein
MLGLSLAQRIQPCGLHGQALGYLTPLEFKEKEMKRISSLEPELFSTVHF